MLNLSPRVSRPSVDVIESSEVQSSSSSRASRTALLVVALTGSISARSPYKLPPVLPPLKTPPHELRTSLIWRYGIEPIIAK